MANQKNSKFHDIAKEQTVFSPVMEGREKTTTQEVIDKYPNGVTLTEFDIVILPDKSGEEKPVPVFAIKEDPGVAFFGGVVLSKMAQAWATAYEGDIATASAELKASGGVKVKLTNSKTKSHNDVVSVEVLG